MSAEQILEEIRRMPEVERRELVDQIEDEFADTLTAEQIAELDRRAEDALKHPGRGRSAEEISAKIRKRLLAKK